MGFTYDLSTNIGMIRLFIQDNVIGEGILPDGANFTDEEIASVYTSTGDKHAASAFLLETAARKWSTYVDTTVGPLKESLSQASKNLLAQADAVRSAYGISVAGGVVAAKLKRDDGYSQSASEGDV